MWKNIGKGGIWFAIYFGLQNIISTILAMIHLFNSPEGMPDISNPDALLDGVMDAVLATVMPALIISALLMIMIYIIHRRVIHEPLHIVSVDWQKMVFFAGVACVLNVLCNALLWFLSTMLPPSWVDSLGASVDMVSTGESFWILLLGTGILIPIMEELTFRYGIHGYIAKSSVPWAYIISAIIFGVMHGNPIQIIYATLFGLVLSFVYQKSGNLWYPIIIHAVNNSMSLCSMLFKTEIAYIITVTAIGLVAIGASVLCFDNVKRMLSKPLPK